MNRQKVTTGSLTAACKHVYPTVIIIVLLTYVQLLSTAAGSTSASHDERPQLGYPGHGPQRDMLDSRDKRAAEYPFEIGSRRPSPPHLRLT